MNTTTAHTPMPWHTLKARTLVNIKGPNGEQICQIEVKREEDAAHIVRCVNSHDAYKALLERAADFLEMNGGMRVALVADIKAELAKGE